MREKVRPSPLRNFLSSFLFTKPSAENNLLCWRHLLLNKLSRIKIAKLISFLTENVNLIEQQPDATGSSDSDPVSSPSPRPQTDESDPQEVQYRGP
ncbi:hypothetical protein AVEN_241938-1 [Araneus ventricosus]|uniref:Uncharacterized protein n=1 Tax=Araneus ventricosus TaxID=182803 RepID=A0A4Y2PF53_ARAVE|nr:hypothetical protein AVEN_241938-1 [Araneus ventricosus]